MKIVLTQKLIKIKANVGPKVENKLKLIDGILVIIIKHIIVVVAVISNLPIIPNILVEVSTAAATPKHEIVNPVPYAAELQNDLPDIAIIT